MGLSASMWTSVSGLLTHGEKMNVIGNNIANINTVGFKAQRMDFQDFIYQNGYSTSGPTQVGRGAKVGAVLGDFSQAAFESTNEATDLAIAGRGFFQVRDSNSGQTWYTRAGDFRFDKEGVLRDPNSLALQGWKIPSSSVTRETSGGVVVSDSSSSSSSARTGSPVDVVLDNWSVNPKATTQVNFSLNLSSDSGNDKTVNSTNPAFGLLTTWDGTKNPPISEDAYAYPATVTVYDEGGTKHTLTMYCDQVAATISEKDANGNLVDKSLGLPGGYTMYEYILTCPPSEDKRTWATDDTVTYDPATGKYSDASKVNNFSDSKSAGVLMTGTLIFDSSGQIVDMTAYTYRADGDFSTNKNGTIPMADGNPDNLSSWYPTRLSTNGHPMIAANFAGIGGGSTVASGGADGKCMELNLGIQSNSSAKYPDYWSQSGSAATVTGYKDLSTDPNNTVYETLGCMVSSQRGSDATTSYSGASLTNSRVQDGYSYGNLTSYNVDTSGIMYGIYSNGVSLPLYQLAICDFVNKEGLRRDGGNLYSATVASGEPQMGPAGEGGLGSVEAYSLEQSNVDMAKEFVQMIATQRGFQANSKLITTVDTMLETVIGMKR